MGVHHPAADLFKQAGGRSEDVAAGDEIAYQIMNPVTESEPRVRPISNVDEYPATRLAHPGQFSQEPMNGRIVRDVDQRIQKQHVVDRRIGERQADAVGEYAGDALQLV